MLKMIHLQKKIRRKPILHDVTLEIERGVICFREKTAAEKRRFSN